MFCLNEESLAKHIGERTPREDVEELAKQEKEKLAAIMQEQEANFDDGVSDATSFFNQEDEEYNVAQVGLAERKR
jgi:hypothetical protein